MIPQPILNTSRLKLRPFSAADTQRVAELANDEEISRNLRSFEFPYSLDDAKDWVSGLPAEWEQGKSAVFAICFGQAEPQQEQLVGAIGIVLDQQSNLGELGYWVGRKYWGQGIATEASQSMLDLRLGSWVSIKSWPNASSEIPPRRGSSRRSGWSKRASWRNIFEKTWRMNTVM